MLAGAPRLDRRPELGEVPLVAIVPERVSVLVEVVLVT